MLLGSNTGRNDTGISPGNCRALADGTGFFLGRGHKQCQSTYTKTEQQNQSGGGTNKDVLDRLEAIERELAELKSREATEETLGLVRLTQSSAVTSPSGLALSAREKNASIEGTLANLISGLQYVANTSLACRGSASDFNSIRKTGFYQYGGAGGTGAPAASAFGILLHFEAPAYRAQVFFSFSTTIFPYIYTRYSASPTGNFDSWKRVKLESFS